MELTDEQLHVAFECWAAARTGGGVVIEGGDLYPAAHALAEAGWLERRFVGDGAQRELAWFWTPSAEQAIEFGALMNNADGRMN